MLHFSRWKTILIWLSVFVSLLLAAPNLFSKATLDSLPSWLPKSTMPLGLDLQGGSHILLQIDRPELIKERVNAVRDDVRRLLRDAKIEYSGLGAGAQSVRVKINDVNKVEDAKTALRELTQPVNASLLGSGNVVEAEIADSGGGQLALNLTDAGIDYRISSAASQSIEVVRKRIDLLGTTEPLVQKEGKDRILVQVPGLDDPERLKGLIGETAKLSFQMVDQTMPAQEAAQGRPPAGSEVLYSQDDPPVPYLVETRVIVSGEDLVDAQASFNQQTSEPVVSFRFNTSGAQKFGQATQQNVGRPFAIVLDGEVLSAPVIREPILQGSGQISGNFTTEGANDLAVLLRAGALPAKLSVIEERTVGPGLGADSIAAGKIAAILAAVLVVSFMWLAYGLFGTIANLALLVHVSMIVAGLSILGATLTLPGIAGIVLTIGMAVDSNVLIYERIKEELRQGRSMIQGIETGFSKALATIVDANVTSFIAAAVLFFLGSGPVKGFAVTFALGIATTVFTAFTFTRWVVAAWLRRRKPKIMPSGVLHLVPYGTKIPFMGIRRFTFGASLIASIASLLIFSAYSMNYGIEFKGGTMLEVQSKTETADVAGIRSKLSELNLGEVQVQSFGSPKDVLIRVEAQGLGDTAEQAVVSNIRDVLSSEYDFRRVEAIGATVSSELATAGLIGVLVSLAAILVYIWIRFEWQYAIGAIIATAHDLVMTIGFFVVTGLEFNLSSIAAILTIVGYSLNDTVVVYDRVRENLRRYKVMPLDQLLDMSMNETLSRTTLTALTTLLALGALFVFGGEVIRSFTAAMIFGVVMGTYSSIFIAAPLLILFGLRPGSAKPEGANLTANQAKAR
jgi:SecD/SecF fusion protein